MPVLPIIKIMIRKFLLFVSVSLVFLMSGCYYDNEETLYPDAVMCDTTNVTFHANIEPIIQGNCAVSGCHVAGGTGSGIFTTYAGLKTKVNNGSLKRRVLERKDMPPNSRLNGCQLSLIKIWLDAGAPNN